MARNAFGGSSSEWFVAINAGGAYVKPNSPQQITLWSGTPEDLGRVQYDDLRALDDPETPINTVPGLADGTLPEFYGPDDVSVTRMWASPDGGVTGTWITTSTIAAVGASGSFDDLGDKPTIPTTAADVGAVPTTRKVNGKALSADVTLAAGDVGAATAAQGAKADSAVQPATTDAAMAPVLSDPESASAQALAAAIGSVDVFAPYPTGNAATDTANAQNAINATPAGGVVLFRTSPAGLNYRLNAALMFNKNISILGSTMTAVYLPRSSGGTINGPGAPYFTGVVFEQQTAGQNIFKMDPTASAISLHMRNIAGTWASAILNTNTGHGIEATTTVVNQTGVDSGLMNFSFENIGIYGHDGNHYGLALTNPIYGTIRGFYAYGGGGFHFHANGVSGGGGNAIYGNFIADQTYSWVFNAGTAHGYNLSGTAATGNVLNFITFNRPQCNLTDAAATQGTQYLWRMRDGGAPAAGGVTIIGPDMEGWSAPGGGLIDFGGLGGGAVVVGLGVLSATPIDGRNTTYARAGYQRFNATGAWTCPDYVQDVRVRVVGGGGGGGGGGDNLAAGGGGGAAAMSIEGHVRVTPGQTYTVTVGSGGGGGANNNSGSSGSPSSFSNLNSVGGVGGAGAPAASTANGVQGGLPGGQGRTNITGLIGAGGIGNYTGGGGLSILMSPGVVGGAGGGGGNGALGGAGGGASATGQGGWPAQGGQVGGARGSQAGPNGGAGMTATTQGCGGGGGGGAGTSGVGGTGGAGAGGIVELWW
jgi:hypothetical protein